MTTLIEFLEARIAEDEAAARAAGGREWQQYDPFREHGRIEEIGGDVVTYDEGSPTEGQAAHIARHDPARVLREVAAKRAMVDAHGDNGKGECETCLNSESDLYGEDREAFPCWHLKTMAAVYSDHEAYRDEWRP